MTGLRIVTLRSLVDLVTTQPSRRLIRSEVRADVALRYFYDVVKDLKKLAKLYSAYRKVTADTRS